MHGLAGNGRAGYANDRKDHPREGLPTLGSQSDTVFPEGFLPRTRCAVPGLDDDAALHHGSRKDVVIVVVLPLWIQIVGSLFILSAFAWGQMTDIPSSDIAYPGVNLLGSGLLALDALSGRQWGFLLLEVGWILVSAIGLVRALRSRTHRADKAIQADESDHESGPTMRTGDIQIHAIDENLTVCKVADYSGVDLDAPFRFTGNTDEEHSLVCPTDRLPPQLISRSDGWRAFRIQGVLDFSLIGILAPIATLLAQAGIGIFALSTYNTDYVLTQSSDFDRAMRILAESGYRIV